jgi:hypothetical protein
MEIIDDPASFTRHILKNPHAKKKEIKEVEEVMEDQLKTRIKAATADNRIGSDRDSYMYFQGCVTGMLIAFKQVKTHYQNSAWEQGVDPLTGEKMLDHGNS